MATLFAASAAARSKARREGALIKSRVCAGTNGQEWRLIRRSMLRMGQHAWVLYGLRDLFNRAPTEAILYSRLGT